MLRHAEESCQDRICPEPFPLDWSSSLEDQYDHIEDQYGRRRKWEDWCQSGRSRYFTKKDSQRYQVAIRSSRKMKTWLQQQQQQQQLCLDQLWTWCSACSCCRMVGRFFLWGLQRSLMQDKKNVMFGLFLRRSLVRWKMTSVAMTEWVQQFKATAWRRS